MFKLLVFVVIMFNLFTFVMLAKSDWDEHTDNALSHLLVVDLLLVLGYNDWITRKHQRD